MLTCATVEDVRLSVPPFYGTRRPDLLTTEAMYAVHVHRSRPCESTPPCRQDAFRGDDQQSGASASRAESGPTVVVLQADYVVLAQVRPELDLDDFEDRVLPVA